MRNVMRLFFIMSLLMLLQKPVFSQVPLPPSRGSNQSQKAQSQRQVDEQLARSFYNNKEYQKAADLYLQLYTSYNNYHYFSQYVECLLFLENYDEARELLYFVRDLIQQMATTINCPSNWRDIGTELAEEYKDNSWIFDELELWNYEE